MAPMAFSPSTIFTEHLSVFCNVARWVRMSLRVSLNSE